MAFALFVRWEGVTGRRASRPSRAEAQPREQLARPPRPSDQKGKSRNEALQLQCELWRWRQTCCREYVIPTLLHFAGFPVESMSILFCTTRCTFLILDRLKETLKDRITRWKLEMKQSPDTARCASVCSIVVEYGNDRSSNKHAYSIASALEYLHSLRIIYRDLKSNIADLDMQSPFGLARPLPEQAERSMICLKAAICCTRRRET